MGARQRSKDGRRDTEQVLGTQGPAGQSGRSGGSLARAVGSEDELKGSGSRPAGATRGGKADKDRPRSADIATERR